MQVGGNLSPQERARNKRYQTKIAPVMLFDPSLFLPGFIGAAVALIVSTTLVMSKGLHGKYSLDYIDGVQKFHSAPTPRVGGLAIFAGFVAAWFFSTGEARAIMGLVGLTGLPALVFGMAEDITKRVGVGTRLIATIFSGLIFTILSGYAVTSVQLPGLDSLLKYALFAVPFTAFAIGGVANSINLIDGFHGLAAGTLMIIYLAFALVSARIGDPVLLALSLTQMMIVAGFFVVNFPNGKLFLGDAGAYFCGYSVAVLAVMLPARNPEVSPWVSLLILGYPVTETVFSILRRLRKKGQSPGAPDSAHLHHLVHLGWAQRFTKLLHHPESKNALTSVFIWVLPLISLYSVAYSNLQTRQSLALLAVGVVIYLLFYRATGLAGQRLSQAHKAKN